MSSFGGAFGKYASYKFKPINSIVYPVYGGMEDWMYASAWDKDNLRRCNSPRLRGAAEESEGRATVFLVETSDEKQPPLNMLGTMTHVLEEGPTGHVPRNIRLGLVAVDTAQPYVCLSKRVAVKRLANWRSEDRRLDVLSPDFELKVRWYAGGAFTTDVSFLSWHRPLLPWADLVKHGADWRQLLSVYLTEPTEIIGSRMSGKARWTFPEPLDPRAFTQVIKVKANLGNTSRTHSSDVTLLAPGDHWLVAWATVDQNWGAKDQVVIFFIRVSLICLGCSFWCSSESFIQRSYGFHLERERCRESKVWWT